MIRKEMLLMRVLGTDIQKNESKFTIRIEIE